MYNILERVKLLRNRDSTRANYYSIWKSFNRFLLQLDVRPTQWEDRIDLFLAHLVHSGKKSATVKSYYSAIKAVLWDDKYDLQSSELELCAITRACRAMNDKL